MFEGLTGSKSAKNVVFATTMWDKLHPKFDDGDKREMHLKEAYWDVMIHHGAAVERFNTSDSAWSIVDNIVKKNDQKAPLLFQEERVDQKKHFWNTSAGEALYLNLSRLIERQTNMMREPVGWKYSNGSGTHSPIEPP